MAEIIRLTFNTAKAVAQFSGMVKRGEDALFRLASRYAMQQSAIIISQRVERDIASAGNFGPRWAASFIVDTRFEGGTRGVMRAGFSIPYAHVHEFGAVIHGRPLLWIPLSWNAFKGRAGEYPGRLFRVEREGRNPLLFSVDDKQAKYVGVKQVTLRPRFHIRQIVLQVVTVELPRLFARYLQGVKI
jgi:hypothetical protein